MANPTHQKIVLAGHPNGMPKLSDFELVENAMPEVSGGEFLIKTLFLGLEPRLRLLMNPTTDDNRAMRPHGAMTGPGKVMVGTVLGVVVESKNENYPIGAFVDGFLGWQNYVLTDGNTNRTNNPEGIHIIDASISPALEFIGALGTPGLTSLLALKFEGRLKPGETMVVTSAAGLVGSIAGQLGLLVGARVVGLTSTDEKVSYLTNTLEFDAAINYRSTKNLDAAIKEACPDGVDYYFDNTGGHIAETIKKQLSANGRVTRCGLVAHYNQDNWGQSEKFAGQFSVHNHVESYEEGREVLADLLNSGDIQYERTIFYGLNSAPQAFIDLLSGKNIGKFLVQVANDLPDNTV